MSDINTDNNTAHHLNGTNSIDSTSTSVSDSTFLNGMDFFPLINSENFNIETPDHAIAQTEEAIAKLREELINGIANPTLDIRMRHLTLHIMLKI